MIDYDRGLPPSVQREWFAVQHREIVKAQQTLRNVENLKAEYDRLVLGGDFSATNAYVLWFSGSPEFLCAELVSRDYDFQGRHLQEPDPPAHLCVYNLAVDDCWALVFGWVGRNSAAEALAESLDDREGADKPAAVLRYVLEYTDNMFFNPDWWDSLPQSEKAWVSFILTRRMHPHYLRDRDLLRANIGVPMTSTYIRAERLGPWSTPAS